MNTQSFMGITLSKCTHPLLRVFLLPGMNYLSCLFVLLHMLLFLFDGVVTATNVARVSSVSNSLLYLVPEVSLVRHKFARPPCCY